MSYMKYLGNYQNEMTEMLQTFVEYETPSRNKQAMDMFSDYLAGLLHNMGMNVTVLSPADGGNHLLADWGEGKEQALILCHMDTVWPLGELKERPFYIKDGKAYGPGVLDMKGGLVQTIFAIRALMAAKKMPSLKIVLLCSSDEEIGSPNSRILIEAEARKSKFVLVAEPAAGDAGAIKLTRKGWGMYDIWATGRSAHSGNDHASGVNAIEELAHHVLKLQTLTNYTTGTTINVGEFHGGKGYNVVPDSATAKIDLRASTMKELMAAHNQIMGLQPVLPTAAITVTGGINRPPLESNPANKALYDRARNLAKQLGFALPGVDVGGASDGNFTSALGIATLDGVGAVGAGAHALHEHIVLAAMAPRAALMAGILYEG